jgi:serine/threonine protein phosphatase PrpC
LCCVVPDRPGVRRAEGWKTDYCRPVHALDFKAVTDPGTVRTVNQDSVFARDGVFVVADGIGGGDAGEIASGLVVAEFAALADRGIVGCDDVLERLRAAHRQVRALNTAAERGVGTTASGAVTVDVDGVASWLIFNIGDSRVYRTEGAGRTGLVQLTVDHSHVQELVDLGVITPAQAEVHPNRNIVTRAVGSEDHFKPDVWTVPIVVGERLLICSDGLLRETSYAQVADIIRCTELAGAAADQLLELSLRSGAKDNVSVIVIDVLEEPGQR